MAISRNSSTTFGEEGNMRRFRQPFVLSIILFAMRAPAATLHGVVRDPKDRPIAGSRVIVFTRNHGDQVTSIANAQGEYRVERLSGEYLAQAESAGLERS